LALGDVRNPGMAKPDGLKPLPAEVADALLRALAVLPDPARDDRLFLRPGSWRNDGAAWSRYDFDVYCRGRCVGRVIHSWPKTWSWSIAGGLRGYAVSREEAMAEFRKAWDERKDADRSA
jgi:hypothetical protein